MINRYSKPNHPGLCYTRLKDEDFKNDAKDAGDMGSGHQVTVLYEIIPMGVAIDLPGVDKSKYTIPLKIDPNAPDKVHAAVREKGSGSYRTTTGAEGGWVRVDDGPVGETKALVSVNIPTGMGGIFLYAGTGEGLLRNPDCF